MQKESDQRSRRMIPEAYQSYRGAIRKLESLAGLPTPIIHDIQGGGNYTSAGLNLSYRAETMGNGNRVGPCRLCEV